MIAPVARELAAACEVGPGDRVLDVGAGTGRLALAAAGRGADEAEVTDVRPLLGAAPSLPYEQGRFSCVASLFGVIHSADPRRVCTQLDRVLCPGGRIGVAAWAPAGVTGQALSLVADRLGRPEARAAARWGRYEDAYRRFGFHAWFEMQEKKLVLRAPDAADAAALLLDAPGPLRAVGAEREAVEPELRELLAAAAVDYPSDSFAAELDYALIVARKPS